MGCRIRVSLWVGGWVGAQVATVSLAGWARTQQGEPQAWHGCPAHASPLLCGRRLNVCAPMRLTRRLAPAMAAAGTFLCVQSASSTAWRFQYPAPLGCCRRLSARPPLPPHPLHAPPTAGRGCIVLLGSVAGLKGVADEAAYTATKWALRGWAGACYEARGRAGKCVALRRGTWGDGPALLECRLLPQQSRAGSVPRSPACHSLPPHNERRSSRGTASRCASWSPHTLPPTWPWPRQVRGWQGGGCQRGVHNRPGLPAAAGLQPGACGGRRAELSAGALAHPPPHAGGDALRPDGSGQDDSSRGCGRGGTAGAAAGPCRRSHRDCAQQAADAA